MPDRTEVNQAARERIDLLSTWIESQMAYREQPGLAIGLVYDQALIWSQGFGLADIQEGTPVTPQTLFRIASITKLFTSTALLQLRDAGFLQLDDPLEKHLPWFSMQPAESDAPPVTLRHLITHTSGLPREAPFPYWTDSAFPDMTTIREKLPDDLAVLAPETQWKYSNLALSLAGEVIATVSGQPYEQYIHTHILEPLGMVHTLVETPEPDHQGIAVGYSRRLPRQGRTRSPHTDARGLTPAFNMASSVEDLAQFIMLQMRNNGEYTVEDNSGNRAQILSPRTLREMQRVHWLEPDWQSGWGLGFGIVRQDGQTWVGHGGAVLGHRTLVGFVPDLKIGVIVLTNADDGDPYRYVQKALQWVAPALAKGAGVTSQSAGTHEEWSAYVGKFRSAWRDTQILMLDGKLTMLDLQLPDPLAFKATLGPVAEHRFRMTDTKGTWPVGELVLFEFDDAGSVHRLKIGDNYSLPVETW